MEYGIIENKIINKKEAINHLLEYGYYALRGFFINTDQVELAKKLATDETYKVGCSYKTSSPSSLPSNLYELVVSSQIKDN